MGKRHNYFGYVGITGLLSDIYKKINNIHEEEKSEDDLEFESLRKIREKYYSTHRVRTEEESFNEDKFIEDTARLFDKIVHETESASYNKPDNKNCGQKSLIKPIIKV